MGVHGPSLRVVFLPDFAGNPYLRMLCEALGERGIRVDLTSDVSGLTDRDAPRYDVVHLHWERFRTVDASRRRALRRSAELVLSLWKLRWSGSRIVWTIHNLRDHEAPHPHIERLAQVALARVADRLVVHYPAAIDHAARWLKTSRARFEVMPMGPYPTPAAIDREGFRRELGIADDVIVLAAVGFIRRYKRIPELIEAVRLLDDRFLLIVAGRPWADEAGRVEAAAAGDPRVVLRLTELSDEELAAVLGVADAFVLASDHQFSSSSALLAMGYGCAVYSGESEHVRYLAGDRGARFFPADASAEAISEVLRGADREDLRAMGAHNETRAASFSWQEAAEILETAYRGGALGP